MAVKRFMIWCAHYAATAVSLSILGTIFPDFLSYYLCTANVILYILIATLTYQFCKNWYNDEKIEPFNKAILITGCDRGFGNALAKRMDSRGFHVFASCLFPEGKGAAVLKQSCSSRLRVFSLDVTKDKDVEEALFFVKQNLGFNVLWTVANNAGIAKAVTPIEFSSMDNFKDTIDMNALGPVRVTKAFLPLLKKSKGRVINITSLSGRVSSTNVYAYTMSKCAAVAFTECLSQEMKEWGIRVISIEPEMFQTGISNPDNVIRNIRVEVNGANKDVVLSYGEEYIKEMEKILLKVLRVYSPNINSVIDDMESAITDNDPCHVYKPRRNIFVRLAFYLVEVAPFEIYETLGHIFLRLLGYPVPKDVQDCSNTL